MLCDRCISGWAADQSDLTQPGSVEIVVSAGVVAAIPAASFREDLRQAGIGDGCKAFQFDPSPHLAMGRNEIEVRFAGTELPLPGGRGHLVKWRDDESATLADSFLAALLAYYRFNPEDHIVEVAPPVEGLADRIREVRLPFRKYTSIASLAELPAEADLVIASSAPTNQPASLALCLPETGDLPDRGVFRLESISSGTGDTRRLFAFAERAAVCPPIFAHIHVPKCAGTSLRAMLERYFGPRHLGLYVDDTYFAYTRPALRNILLRDPGIQGFSSHHVRSFPRWLAGREMLYVTFLRDPIEQFVSYMTHIKKHYARITAKNLLEAVPPDAPHLTLHEFARWLLTQDRDIPFRENHNVHFFARHSAPRAADPLSAAKAALSEFFFVGITERMDECFRKLQALTCNTGLDFPPGPMPVENISSDCRDDLSWLHPDDEVGSLLLRSVALDRQLYDWAVDRLVRYPDTGSNCPPGARAGTARSS